MMASALHSLWMAFGWLLVLLTLPMVIELALLTFSALLYRSGPLVESAETPPRLAVIVPAHNEERMIARTVTSLLASSKGIEGVRVLVIAHNCTDATAEISRASGADVRVLDSPSLRGKGAALAFAFASIATDAYLVVDADSVVDAQLIKKVADALRSNLIVQCRYEALAPGKEAKRRLAAVAFRAVNVIRARGRARLGLSCGLLGNGFALRKSLLERIPYDAHSIVEDLEFHLKLVRAGVKVGYLDEVIVRGEVLGTRSQHARWEGGRLLMARRWLGTMARNGLQGQWRMAEPALDLATLPLAQGVGLLMIALLIPVPWVKVYALQGLWVVTVHVMTAIAAGDDFWGETRAILTAPIYILRKIWTLGAVFGASAKDADWVRTDRDGQ